MKILKSGIAPKPEPNRAYTAKCSCGSAFQFIQREATWSIREHWWTGRPVAWLSLDCPVCGLWNRIRA